MSHLLSVAVGGALGAVARYGLSGWVHTWAEESFPWGTLTVNVVGSFLLGAAFLYLDRGGFPAELRHFATIGLLGAFTTFSTFTFETVTLLQDGEWGRAGAYVVLSVALGVVAVLLGFLAAEALLGDTMRMGRGG